MTPLLKKLLILLGILAMILVFYVIASTGKTGVDDVSYMSDSDLLIRSEKILENTRKIRALRIDQTLFTDSDFASLSDTRVSLPDIRTGRQNPFSPVQ